MPLRVALFTDTFEEINGVALTIRQFTGFARRHEYPLLCIRGAERTHEITDGSVIHHELERSRFSFRLDRGLLYDPVLWRTGNRIGEALTRFRPDIVHVVSPGDVSMIGVYLAKKHKIPLAISWHTNLHEFGAMRLQNLLDWAPDGLRAGVGRVTEAQSLRLLIEFYRLGNVLYAPNPELVEMLRQKTQRPVFLMKRGIDTELFNPARRTVNDGVLRIGYVGRITPEKSVRLLQKMEAALRSMDLPPFRFLIVGDGSELDWLRANMKSAEFPGIRRGVELSQEYANMDVFAFPSRTDTFGNVVLEAFASGVPAVVTNVGGPMFIVNHNSTGFIAQSDSEFIEHTARLLRDAALRTSMGQAAREHARQLSWDEVFGKVYDGYLTALPEVFRPPSQGLHAIKTFHG